MTKRLRFTLQLTAAALILQCTMQAQTCTPFTDVLASSGFCPSILQAYANAVTAGTAPGTFSPNQETTRAQMAVFVGQTMNATLRRSAVRTAIGKTWLPTAANAGVATDVGGNINDIVSDGT